MFLEDFEAQNKTCPIRGEEGGDLLPCLGSKCMAWRFTYDGNYSLKTGFCGLAGGPVTNIYKQRKLEQRRGEL